MNLEPFQDIQFEDDEGFEEFKLALQLNHDKIARVMFSMTPPLTYKTYPLIESNRSSQDWQQNLQQELQSIYTLNGLTGLPDFSGADLSREGEFEDVLQQLIFVERKINAALGIV